jgi:nucleotide-binding universal stress UspA family protein
VVKHRARYATLPADRIRAVLRPVRFLVAIDFSPQSLAALRAARSLAKRTGGTVTLVHVRPLSDVKAAVSEERGDLLRLPPGGLAKAVTSHYEKRLGRVMGRSREEYVLRRGAAAVELRREAARGYDVLVMGTHGRGRTTAFLLGSTVQEVLVRSSIPLLVIPPG